MMKGSFRHLQQELKMDRTRLQDIYGHMIGLYSNEYMDLATKVDLHRLLLPGALQRLMGAP